MTPVRLKAGAGWSTWLKDGAYWFILSGRATVAHGPFRTSAQAETYAKWHAARRGST